MSESWWTAAGRDDTLRRLWPTDTPVAEIARALGCSETAARVRAVMVLRLGTSPGRTGKGQEDGP